jgi:hypothetical protein
MANYIITKAETIGSKFGSKGDAQVVIHFSIPNATNENYIYALQMLKMSTPSWHNEDREGIRIIPNSSHPEFNKLIYNPRIDYTYNDPEEWEMESMEKLIEQIAEFTSKVEEALPKTGVAVVVKRMLDGIEFSTNSIEWRAGDSKITDGEKTEGIWCINVSLHQPSYSDGKWAAMLDRTHYTQSENVDIYRSLRFTTEEFSKLNIAWAEALYKELADEVNEMSIRRAAYRKLREKAATKQLKVTSCTGLYLEDSSTSVMLSTYRSKLNHLIKFGNGYELMQKVTDLDIDTISEAIGNDTAIAVEAAQRTAQLAEDADQRASERKAVRDAKKKLETQWVELKKKAKEIN